MLVTGDPANTRTLYSCQDGADGFTSTDGACEGKTVTGEIGKVFTQQPTNVATLAIYRCKTATDHFDSRQATCGGVTQEGLLGYTLAYAPVTATYNVSAGDRMTTVGGGLPSYYVYRNQGYLPLIAQTGSQALMSCANDSDKFLSLDAACEGKTVLGTAAQIWAQPPAGLASQPLYRCAFSTDALTATSTACDGAALDTLLGYTLTALPDVTPVFAGAGSARQGATSRGTASETTPTTSQPPR
jgi:hypothetical protein